MPSVLSASQPSASKRKVFAAWANAARELTRRASAPDWNLKGTVTLQPRAPLAAKSRTACAKPSIAHSTRV